VISGVRREVDGNCFYYVIITDVLGRPVAGSPIGTIVKGRDGTDRLSRNFGKNLPLLTAQ